MDWWQGRVVLGDSLYINNKKTTQMTKTARHQSPIGLSLRGSFTKSVPNENDIVKPDCEVVRGIYKKARNR